MREVIIATMAKKPGKKGKMPGRFNRSEQQQRPDAPNPFELLHSRKKFDVMGKKQKGVAKKVSKSRNEGTQKVHTWRHNHALGG